MNKKASQIGFGVEIECNIPNEYSADFPKGSYHHGLQIPVAPSAGWNCQSDGSVVAPSGFFSAEIVSPVLKGESGLVEIVQMLDLLDQIGARTNISCGLHVHVGIEGLSEDQINRLVKVFKAFEKAFYALNGNQAVTRMNSTYCKPSARWDGTRYQSLNLQKVHNGHIEIRVWSGTLSPEVVVSAIYMAVSLVSRVSYDEKIKTSDLVRNSKPTQVMASFIHRFVKAETMIVDDMDPADLFTTMIQQAMVSNI